MTIVRSPKGINLQTPFNDFPSHAPDFYKQTMNFRVFVPRDARVLEKFWWEMLDYSKNILCIEKYLEKGENNIIFYFIFSLVL